MIATVPNARPWYELRSASTWLERRFWVASSRAASFASVPELVKKTLASGMPDSSAIFSASSIWRRIRYTVEVCAIPVSSCARTASEISAMSYPIALVRMPAKKSRYSLPSPSVTRRPDPFTISIGCS